MAGKLAIPYCFCLLTMGLVGISLIGADGVTQVPSTLAVPQVPPKSSLAAAPALVQVRSPISFGPDTQLLGKLGHPTDRKAMLAAINHSLRYLNTAGAAATYRQYPIAGVTRDRVSRSLVRFRQLLLKTASPEELQAIVQREFIFYQATGKDGQGTVGFTGYFEPIHVASRVPTQEFRYPIFRLPPWFSAWPKPHPTRIQLEGADGLQFAKGGLKGLELFWLRDRLEAFLVQVQGSARLQLTQGGTATVGYAATTDYPYTSIGRELVKAGKIKLAELSLPQVMQYFNDHPEDLNLYLPRNQRFVFFQETGGAPAMGSLGVPVTPERSIATDKTLFPPGALALIQTQIPYQTASDRLEQQSVSRYVLDQDTGGAIKGAGRVDIFMGTGKVAGDRAGLINSTGTLHYLLLKY